MLALLFLLLLSSLVSGRNNTDKTPWRCPEITQPPAVTCSCDLPHTLRCTGGSSALQVIAEALRGLVPPAAVSLLDCTVQNVSSLPGTLLEGVILHGLVVSSGEIHHVADQAFSGLAGPLQALGLPNNKLQTVPTEALSAIPALDRLDLSHNFLETLSTGSFKGLFNLTFLELSENRLSALEDDAISSLPKLQTLRLRGNRLGVNAVSVLRGMRSLQELDVSDNLLAGPLGSTTLPALPGLRVLQLAHNQISSVRRGALTGFASLVSLTLNHNQIDVLEDNAFSELRTLTQLDMAHNRIVAVSGNSLAHLSRLVQLDLAHNFLRALTADLVVPLRNLKELRLDDNDISMVTSDALTSGVMLRRLTLADNPLNCDCSLAEFAEWLTNSSHLPASDQATAVCATPPSLENGLLAEVSPHELLCGEDEEDTGPAPPQGPLAPQVPVSGKQVTLHIFHYDGYSVKLLWNVEASAAPYACDALFVYEEVGAHEVLLESNPVRCNSSQLADPRALTLTLSSSGLLLGHRYRYCVVLLEGGGVASDEMALVLGCSDIIPLIPTAQPQSQPLPEFSLTTHIAALHANVSSPGTLLIVVQLWEQPLPDAHCSLAVAVFTSNSPIAQQHLNCSNPRTVIGDLPVGPYRVCATTGDFPSTGPRARCITVQQPISSQDLGGTNIAIATGFVALSTVLLLGLILGTRRLFRRPKLLPTHQCFLAGPQDEEQHSRYVKLHATTKL
ncbi:insulin-like growth factor-binding protein complex acid labile subunit [Zootermopsis nevadensis]|nr:insulin-like growth factor-binding protein complex acid labile subunit [Zootermopsis nevadensis]XP_021931326.1 insulin-like growth factor-binding protein complex acid labile subunit [Zootermopsis nevadensis]